MKKMLVRFPNESFFEEILIDMDKFNPEKTVSHDEWYYDSEGFFMGHFLFERNSPEINKKNMDLYEWVKLSTDPNAIRVLEKNLDKVSWVGLSTNTNAIHIFEKHLHKAEANWGRLSANPGMIPILQENFNKIDFRELSSLH